jgi:predicted ATP-dependent endonuclease of OLD family
LVEKLLNLIDAHSHGRQVILSTHSSQVVSWTDPRDLRLVVREGRRTVVTSIPREELRRAQRYLDDEGASLGEWVFGRADASSQ